METHITGKPVKTILIVCGIVYALWILFSSVALEFIPLFANLKPLGTVFSRTGTFALVGVCFTLSLYSGIRAQFEAPVIIGAIAILARFTGGIGNYLIPGIVSPGTGLLEFFDPGILVFHMVIIGLVPILIATDTVPVEPARTGTRNSSGKKREMRNGTPAAAYIVPWVFLAFPVIMYIMRPTVDLPLVCNLCVAALSGFALHKAITLTGTVRYRGWGAAYTVLASADAVPLILFTAGLFVQVPSAAAVSSFLIPAAGLLLFTAGFPEETHG